MKFSFELKTFFGVAALIFIVNLLFTNDYTTFWNGAESDLLFASQTGEGTLALFPKMKMVTIAKMIGFQSFMLRLPAVIILIFSLVGFWFFGRKVFGDRTTLFTILVLISSFLVPNLSKWATGDAWLFASHLLTATTLILYIKRPTRGTLIASVLFSIVGLGTNFYATSLFLIPLLGYWFVRHPQGKKTGLLAFLPAVVLFITYGVLNQKGAVAGSYLAPFELSIPKYLGISLLGMLPWIAFLPAAIIDMFTKLKKNEEMSIITSGWLLAGLLSFSISLQAAFAFLIAKQIQAFFHPNYPYTNWVKTFGVLNIVGAFVGGMILMVNGFYFLEMEGFRLGMSIGAVYWIPGFIGIVGLMGKKNRLMMGGMATSGLLLTFFFWARIGPVLETFRGLPEQVTSAAAATGKNEVMYFLSEEEVPKNYKVEGMKNFQSVMTIGVDDMQSIRPTVKDAMVCKNEIPESFRFSKDTKIDTIEGREGLYKEETKWLIINK
jgi:4-amino-4-deoxy-L-arabinose transferase-like glycosyltransferase